MPVFIDNNARAQKVAADMMKLCTDFNLVISIKQTQVPGPGGAVINAYQPGTVKFRVAPNLSDKNISPGCKLLYQLTIDSTIVMIRGLGSSDNDMTGSPIINSIGVASPIIVRGGKNLILIEYDVEGCSLPGKKPGYYAVSQDEQTTIDFPLDVVLYHELCHAWRSINGINASISREEEERQTAVMENEYRTFSKLPLRATTLQFSHEGGANCTQAVASQPAKGTSGKKCFVATAAYGSPLEPEVQILRNFRDDILLTTRTGKAFFEEFHNYYYQYSPVIAEAMIADPAMLRSFRIVLVAPIYNFIRLFLKFPTTEIESLPEPWQTFLSFANNIFKDWAEQIPLPTEFNDIDPIAATTELGVFLRYRLRTKDLRNAYIHSLKQSFQIPLRMDERQRIDARKILESFEQEHEIINDIVGIDNEMKVDYTSNGLHAAIGLNERPNPLPDRFMYTVTITNRTDLTADPVTFEEVVLTFARQGGNGIEFRFEENVAPGRTVVFALCPCNELQAYSWGFRFKLYNATTNQLEDAWNGLVRENPPGSGNWEFYSNGPHSMDQVEINRDGRVMQCEDSFIVGP